MKDMDKSIVEGVAVARAGDVGRLVSWLQDGNTPNQYDENGWTPLLWASARGHAAAIKVLLDSGSDLNMIQPQSGALPIHLAGQSGSVESVKIILEHQPDHINAVLELNGHTPLLQAVFYGHLELAEFLLRNGADTSITTARGLGPMELATQFQNKEIMQAIRPYDRSKEEKAAYYQEYLKRIAPVVPEHERPIQQLSDQLISTIESGLRNAASDPDSVQATLLAVKVLVEIKKADVNRLGGQLQQPPLIVTVTGNNGFPPNPDVTQLRNQLAAYLLEQGADSTLHEKHPMGAQTIIRAAVFNHLEILKMCAERMKPEVLTEAINEIPAINGLTAMHDTVLRATMAASEQFEGYLEQARWFVNHGGRSDIEDFSGVTQRDIAARADNQEVRKRLLEVLDRYH
jgi:hypothetical protein